MFAVCAKGVYLYASQHLLKEELLSVEGFVRDVRLGGQGKATALRIESQHGTHRYSSYYGKVWPGMERIQAGDQVSLLAERKRLNTNELITGRQYYIWELTHRRGLIINYEDVRDMVQGKEATANRYINLWMATSLVLLLVAYLRKLVLRLRANVHKE
jgi:hypothetical protein